MARNNYRRNNRVNRQNGGVFEERSWIVATSLIQDFAFSLVTVLKFTTILLFIVGIWFALRAKFALVLSVGEVSRSVCNEIPTHYWPSPLLVP
jgi:hypothetical protein